MKINQGSIMTNTIKGFTLILIIFSCISIFGQNNTVKPLDKEIKALITNQSNSLGISQEEMKIAESIHGFGNSAIPELVKLLKHPDSQVRKRTAFTLSLFNDIDEIYLDDLIEALNNGEEWLAPNIAKIGSDKAINSRIDAIKKNKEAESTLGHSFEILGSKSIPYLIKLLDCKDKCDEDLLYTVSSIFGFLGEKAIPAINILDSLARSKSNSIDSRKFAIRCFGEIGVYAMKVDSDLVSISKNESDNFSSVVLSALNEMKSPLAVELLVNKLDTTKSSHEKILIMRDIAQIGHNAIKAGEFILKYLNDDDWDLRVVSARTIGFIGYKPAISALIKLLDYESDWRLNYVSVQSLELLNAKEAINSLKEVESKHWYSLVRETAQKAISNITNSKQVSIPNYNFPFYFFSYENDGENIENCDIKKDYKQMRLDCWSGFLTGEDKGEWGGSLKFDNTLGNEFTLLNDNIKSIYRIDNNIVVIAGLAHLSFNRGTVYQLIHTDDKIIVKKILILPGAPLKIQKLKENEFMIATIGGTVILSKDLKLRQATCKEK
jgi:HEAT repeat protein